jgi:preprotein translocase subunit SecA
MKLFSGLLDSNEKEIKRLRPYVDRVLELEADFKALSDDALKVKTLEFKEKIKAATSGIQPKLDEAENALAEARKLAAGATWEGEKSEAAREYQQAQDRIKKIGEERKKLQNEALDEILPEAFAAVRESARRAIGQVAFPVQLMGGVTLHQGKIAEMRTGEGKTLTATFPLYLNALTGRGVHLVTVNDYLARFHAYWMGPIFYNLGLNVAAIYPMQTSGEHQPSRLFDPDYDSGQEKDPWHRYLKPISRKQAYEADITYGTAAEFGFDFLRDNMVTDMSLCVQRPLYYAIVDEVDNLLIDEARTPLIISAPDTESGLLYQKFAMLVTRLKRDDDYDIKEKEQSADLNEVGWDKVETMLKRDGLLKAGDSLYSNGTLMHHLRNALSAKEFYRRDQRYVVENGEVVIVDEFTGRKMFGRRYSEGLHQAIEAKEHIKVQQESKTYATVTIQNYFRMYEKLGGMTGTALTEAEEFYKIYKLDVTEIPTNRPMIREDLGDQIYKTEAGKFKAVAAEIKRIHETGAPVLIGTVSIEKSEMLSDMLKRQGIDCKVLNAKKHTEEAAIVSRAGELGAVTVATNMAGRGVDIILGGNPGIKSFEDIDTWIHNEFQKLLPTIMGVDETRSLLSKFKKTPNELLSEYKTIFSDLSDILIQIYLKKENNDKLKIILEEKERKNKQLFEIWQSIFLTSKEQLLALLSEAKKGHDIDDKKIVSELEVEIENFKNWIINHLKVIELGGLHIIGTERHEARRIDNQLRGRAGRQGDPGSSRFYVSLEDDIMKRFGGDRLKTVMGMLGLDEDTPIENKLITNSITDVQKRVEGYHFDVRKNLVEYDDVVNKHRELIYEERRKILSGADLKTNMLKMTCEEISGIVNSHAPDKYGEGRDDAGMLAEIKRIIPLSPAFTIKNLEGKRNEEIEKYFVDMASAAYDQREKEMGEEKMRLLERLLMLQIIDRLWVDHLTIMENERMQANWDTLRQVKSADAYKNAGFRQFQELLENIRHDVAGLIFHVSITDKNPNKAPQSPMAKADTGSKGDSKPRASTKIGRNDPCPCGSGKKYKHCCGK